MVGFGPPPRPRQLKLRAQEEVRPVPCHPALTAYIDWHIEQFGTSPDGRLFCGEPGGDLSESVYGRAWHGARLLALTPAIASSSLARRPCDLRHACLSTWLNGVVEPTQAAQWAGNSVQVLLRVYAKCIAGRDESTATASKKPSATTPARLGKHDPGRLRLFLFPVPEEYGTRSQFACEERSSRIGVYP